MAVKKYISLDYEGTIVIGKRGENEAYDMVFEIEPLINDYGSGTALILAKRSMDESAYPVSKAVQDGNEVTWTVTNVDTNNAGAGEVQLFWYIGARLAKSYKWNTIVCEDITGVVGDAPDAYETWLEELASLGAEIVEDAKAEAANAEAWAVGERDGAPVEEGDEAYHNNAKYYANEAADRATDAEEQAQAAAESAGAAAESASGASGYANDARDFRDQAGAHAQTAGEKAELAAGSAGTAGEYANAAAGSASGASGYANSAAGSADSAGASALVSEGYATGKQNGAPVPSESPYYHNNAAFYNDEAAAAASDASDSAEAAADSAEAAAASAALFNVKSGAIICNETGGVVQMYPDKTIPTLYKAEVSLSPIQSLNGYDHPWAEGAGKNLVDGEYTTNASGPTSHITTNFVIPTTGTTITASAHTADGAAVNTGNCAINFKDANNTQLLGISPTQTKTAPDLSAAVSIEIFTTAALANKKIYVQLEYGSTATSFAPYENLCPISGHTGATLNVTGKNLVDFSVLSESGITATKVNGYAHIEGTASNIAYPVNGIVTTLHAGTYVWSVSGLNEGMSGAITKDGSWGGNLTQGAVMTLTEDTQVGFYVRVLSGTVTNTDVKVMLEKASTATDWEPYVGSQHTSSFGQTVYGGTFDFVSGKLVVEWANIDSYNGETITEPWLSSMDVYSAGATPTTGAQVVYKLATPIVIDLDPTEVQTLIGTNNIWSDGEMSVDYAADLKTYIDNKIAAAVAALS